MMKTNYYEEMKWITKYDGQIVIVKEKDGTITKGKCKIYIEGPYADMDREMWVSNRIIALDDIIDIEPCDFGILNESVFNINNNKQR